MCVKNELSNISAFGRILGWLFRKDVDLINSLTGPLQELEEYKQCVIAMEKGTTPVSVTGVAETGKSQFIASFDAPIRLIVTYDEVKAHQLVDDLRMYDPEVLYYPARDLMFFSADIHGGAITGERLKVIKRLREDKPATIVTTIEGGMDYCVPFDSYQHEVIDLKTGDTIDLTKFSKALVEMGYESVSMVESEGEFQIHGGIIDIFPESSDVGYRIELWDDEIESIRSIDIESQRSIEKEDSITITPAREMMFDEDQERAALHMIKQESEERERELRSLKNGKAADKLHNVTETFLQNYEIYHGSVNLESYLKFFINDKPVSFFDYFIHKNTIVFIDEASRVYERAEAVFEEFGDSMSMRLEQGYILPSQTDLMFKPKEVVKKLLSFPMFCLSMLESKSAVFPVKKTCGLRMTGQTSYNRDFELLVKDLKRYVKNGYRVLIVTASGTGGKRLVDNLMDYDILSFYDSTMTHELRPSEVMVTRGGLRSGFEYPDLKFVVLTEGDIFGKKRQKKRVKRYNGASIHSFNELKVGDYVVHENHGLGIYQGIEKIEVDHKFRDYLKVSYAAGSFLYVPATSLEVLQKYSGSEGRTPKLNRLGTKEWTRTKDKVRQAVEEIAEELVELYALRQKKKGHAFSEDTVWQKEMEEIFPYDETDDQLDAIADVKADMESDAIMDRLICGDVGYGKTEVAIRAAFKAVMDGYQVAVLVPTTILASQHFSTFSERMKGFGVNVELLCRLRTAGEQRKTIEGLKKGSVDIVVGTHKLLGKTVDFKKLGLLIIDEEQRFGVRHKEKIKQLKNTVDVLAMSATPIPRTLHMSLIGIRDMSVLTQAPEDRMPIQTFVMERSDEIAREAINRELKRGGQVYYIYNRVNTIADVTADLQKLVPDAVIEYAHGQMDEKVLEDTMLRFVSGDIDVLVATTIVESGLDIPNVNTIIIEDADRLGLSQLYQLRGRVGRSGRAAYAFLMYRKEKLLKEVAEKRLAAIKEFTELGSGIRISMKDLELRGAGNLLGTGQHGHMEAVGYDLYCKMLETALRKLKGEETIEEEFETTIDIKVDSFIPMEYIRNEFVKLDIYKRIAELETEEEIMDMREELTDRFGAVPTSVENLLKVTLIKAAAHRCFVTELTESNGLIRASMYPQAKIDPMGIPPLVRECGGRLRFEPERTVIRAGKPVEIPPAFVWKVSGDPLTSAGEFIGKLEGLVGCPER